MTASLIPQGGNLQLPAYLQNKVPAADAASLVTTGESLPRISIRGRRFRFKIGSDERALPDGAPLDVIILAADPKSGVAKTYFEGAYAPGSAEQPDCSSSDGVFPDSWVLHKQHSNCAECPKNMWGSAKSNSGKDIKACKDVKHLLVVPATRPDATVFVLQVPPMSLKALSKYGRALAEHKLSMHWVITRVTFTPDSEYPQLEFSFGGFLEEQVQVAAESRATSDEIQSLLHDTPTPALAAPSQPVAAAPQSATIPAPQPHPETAPVSDAWGAAPETTQTPQAAPAELPPDHAVPAGQSQPELPWGEPITSPQPAVTAPAAAVPTDATGAVWDPSIHAKSREGKPVYNSNGTFRKRRGAATRSTQPAPAEAKLSPDEAMAQLEAMQQGQTQAPAAESEEKISVENILQGWN